MNCRFGAFVVFTSLYISSVYADLQNARNSSPLENFSNDEKQIKQYSNDQLQYQFQVLKACTQTPSSFSERFISRLQQIFVIFADELRNALLREVDATFRSALSATKDKDVVQQLTNEYFVTSDSVKNWDISRKTLDRAFDRVAAYEKNEIAANDLQLSIAEIIKDEILEAEKAFHEGDIGSFLKNTVIIDSDNQSFFISMD